MYVAAEYGPDYWTDKINRPDEDNMKKDNKNNVSVDLSDHNAYH